MNVIEGTGEVVPEPDWDSLLNDVLEIDAAREHWRKISTELRERQLLSPANAHALQRLIIAYVVYDRCSREVIENGPVTKPKRGNARSIARLSPYVTAMREMAADAVALEAEFGLAPRRRSTATKAERKQKVQRASDSYLRRSPGG